MPLLGYGSYLYAQYPDAHKTLSIFLGVQSLLPNHALFSLAFLRIISINMTPAVLLNAKDFLFSSAYLRFSSSRFISASSGNRVTMARAVSRNTSTVPKCSGYINARSPDAPAVPRPPISLAMLIPSFILSGSNESSLSL